MIPLYTNCQNLQCISYVHWNSDRAFNRYDVYLGVHDGFKYYWSFEPGGKSKYNKILKTDGKLIWVLEQNEDKFTLGVANQYLSILNQLHTESVLLTDKTFKSETKALSKVNPRYKDLVHSIILSH